MPKTLFRFVALLLVPCLLSDPGAASVFSVGAESHHPRPDRVFEAQALATPLINATRAGWSKRRPMMIQMTRPLTEGTLDYWESLGKKHRLKYFLSQNRLLGRAVIEQLGLRTLELPPPEQGFAEIWKPMMWRSRWSSFMSGRTPFWLIVCATDVLTTMPKHSESSQLILIATFVWFLYWMWNQYLYVHDHYNEDIFRGIIRTIATVLFAVISMIGYVHPTAGIAGSPVDWLSYGLLSGMGLLLGSASGMAIHILWNYLAPPGLQMTRGRKPPPAVPPSRNLKIPGVLVESDGARAINDQADKLRKTTTPEKRAVIREDIETILRHTVPRSDEESGFVTTIVDVLYRHLAEAPLTFSGGFDAFYAALRQGVGSELDIPKNTFVSMHKQVLDTEVLRDLLNGIPHDKPIWRSVTETDQGFLKLAYEAMIEGAAQGAFRAIIGDAELPGLGEAWRTAESVVRNVMKQGGYNAHGDWNLNAITEDDAIRDLTGGVPATLRPGIGVTDRRLAAGDASGYFAERVQDLRAHLAHRTTLENIQLAGELIELARKARKGPAYGLLPVHSLIRTCIDLASWALVCVPGAPRFFRRVLSFYGEQSRLNPGMPELLEPMGSLALFLMDDLRGNIGAIFGSLDSVLARHATFEFVRRHGERIEAIYHAAGRSLPGRFARLLQEQREASRHRIGMGVMPVPVPASRVPRHIQEAQRVLSRAGLGPGKTMISIGAGRPVDPLRDPDKVPWEQLALDMGADVQVFEPNAEKHQMWNDIAIGRYSTGGNGSLGIEMGFESYDGRTRSVRVFVLMGDLSDPSIEVPGSSMSRIVETLVGAVEPGMEVVIGWHHKDAGAYQRTQKQLARISSLIGDRGLRLNEVDHGSEPNKQNSESRTHQWISFEIKPSYPANSGRKIPNFGPGSGRHFDKPDPDDISFFATAPSLTADLIEEINGQQVAVGRPLHDGNWLWIGRPREDGFYRMMIGRESLHLDLRNGIVTNSHGLIIQMDNAGRHWVFHWGTERARISQENPFQIEGGHSLRFEAHPIAYDPSGEDGIDVDLRLGDRTLSRAKVSSNPGALHSPVRLTIDGNVHPRVQVGYAYFDSLTLPGGHVVDLTALGFLSALLNSIAAVNHYTELVILHDVANLPTLHKINMAMHGQHMDTPLSNDEETTYGKWIAFCIWNVLNNMPVVNQIPFMRFVDAAVRKSPLGRALLHAGYEPHLDWEVLLSGRAPDWLDMIGRKTVKSSLPSRQEPALLRDA